MFEFSITSIALAIVTIWILYKFSMRPYDYWKNQGIPSPPVWPIFGNLATMFMSIIHDVDLARYKKYGRTYGVYEFWKPVLMVGELKHVKDILVKDFQTFPGARYMPAGDSISANMLFSTRGENWKRLRMIITPVFSTGKIKKMFSILTDSSKMLAENFSIVAKSGKAINMKEYFGAFSMDVIACTAFGTKVDSHSDPNNPFVKYAYETFFGPSINKRFAFLMFFPKLAKLLKMSAFRPDGLEFFKKATLQIIEERKRTGVKRNDFLQLLMEAEYDESASLDEDIDEAGYTPAYEHQNIRNGANSTEKAKSYHSKRLTHDELIAQCVLFFLGGYEATSTMMSFLSYSLATNPECQEKLIQEIDECLRQNKEGLTYDLVMNMKYLDMVISENLRLYCPTRIERLAETDYKLAGTNLTIPKGMVIGIPVYAIHRDPEYYQDPMKFDPNRFSAEEKAKRDPFAYMPFSVGPRNCLANRFALVQLKACLAFMLSQFRFKRSSKTAVPLVFRKGAPFIQAKEILLEIEERTDRVVL